MRSRFDTVFALFFISLVTMGGIHVLATLFYLYWLYPWFDMPMHFLGGVVVGLGYHSAPLWMPLPRPLMSLSATLLAVLVVGIGWEVFESIANVPVEARPILDTASDLALDVVGGALAFLLATRIRTHFSV